MRDGMRAQNMMPETTVVRENNGRYQRRQRLIRETPQKNDGNKGDASETRTLSLREATV